MNWLEEAKEAAEEVFSVLGEGWKESVYEEALAHEFRLRKIPYERQRNFEILYKGYKVGDGRADLILNPLWAGKGGKEFVLELKAVKRIRDSHIRQVQVYMISLNIDEGGVLSFGDGIVLERVSKPQKILEKGVVKPSRSRKEIETILKHAAKTVYDYFGVEFLYRERGLEIFPNAIGVELRLNGIDFSASDFPICYKYHQVETYNFNFVFKNMNVANVLYYKNEEEIDEELKRLKPLLRELKINKCYLICIPLNADDKVLLETM